LHARLFCSINRLAVMSADERPEETPASEQPPASPVSSETLCYAFEQLATGADEVQITFQGQVYRLRRTRNGRLIMTK